MKITLSQVREALKEAILDEKKKSKSKKKASAKRKSKKKSRRKKRKAKRDACYHKVKSRYSVWPSAYASGAVVNASGTNFTFRDTTAQQHKYNVFGGNIYTKEEGTTNMWTLVVHFVRVFSKPNGSIS